MKIDEEQVKRMADLMKSGATMLSEHCPECNSPLFKLDEEIWCSHCNRKVVIVKDGRELTKSTTSLLLSEIEKTILTKMQESNEQIRNENEPTKLQKSGILLNTWLKALEIIKKLQKSQ